MKLGHTISLVAVLAFGCTPQDPGGGGKRGTGGTNAGGNTGAGGSAGGGGDPGAGGGVVPPWGTGGTPSGSGGTGTTGTGSGGGNSGSGGAGGSGVGGRGGNVGPGTGGRGGSAGASGTGGAVPCTSNPSDYQYPFQDPCKPLEERVTNLLSLLTPDEKIGLAFEHQEAVSRLGIRRFTNYTEGVHGLGWAKVGANDQAGLTSTQFPQAFGLAQSWDPDVMRIVGDTTGAEARIHNAQWKDQGSWGVGLVIRAPVVDLGRDPRWGRTEESYGEDPYLVSELGKGMIAGLHGNDPTYLMTAATLKHFIAYNNETNRNKSDSLLDERNLREYYAVPFYETIRNAKADSLMTSYNKVNGSPGAIHPWVKSLVFGEWGFTGMVCIDAYAASQLVGSAGHNYTATMGWSMEKGVAEILKSGQILTGDGGSGNTFTDVEALRRAYQMKLLTVADLDLALRGSLRMRFRLGDFDPANRVPYKKVTGNEASWNSADYKARALDVARRSVVLLKNDETKNLLPLNKTTINSIAVVGPRANEVLRDWYGGLATYKVSALQGIQNKVGVAKVKTEAMGAAADVARSADVAVVVVGNHPQCGQADRQNYGVCPSMYEGREPVDRKSILLDPAQETLVKTVFAANPKTIVVLLSGFPHGVKWIADNVPAIVHIANSGQEIGTALADVLFGDYNPAGRTTMTWYASEADIPTTILDYDIRKGTTYWYFTGTPVFPFGHGLSYAKFDYANFAISGSSVALSSSVTVSVDVTNSGTRAADEVVQMYVAYPQSATLPRPRQQLRGFRRISLMPGQKQTVTFALPGTALTYWDAAAKKFALQSGTVQVQVGSTSKDIRAMASLTVAP